MLLMFGRCSLVTKPLQKLCSAVTWSFARLMNSAFIVLQKCLILNFLLLDGAPRDRIDGGS